MTGAVHGYRNATPPIVRKGETVFIVGVAKKVRPADYARRLDPAREAPSL